MTRKRHTSKKHLSHKEKKTYQLLHWIGFGIVVVIMTCITAYGFSLSWRPERIVFHSAPDVPISRVWVALANNIWIGHLNKSPKYQAMVKDARQLHDTLTKSVFSEGDFFEEHFVLFAQMRQVLWINIVTYLDESVDREVALDGYIQTLKDLGSAGSEKITLLRQNKATHAAPLEGLKTEIQNTQSQIEMSYAARDSSAIFELIQKLWELRWIEQEHKNIVVFTSILEREYMPMLQDIEGRLVVIESNKPALTQWITVTLPEKTSLQTLKNLNIFTSQ